MTAGCANSLLAFGNSCYRIYISRRPWQDAKSKCEQNSGHLIRIQTRAELDFISESVSNKKHWIDSISVHAWMDGSPALPNLTDSSGDGQGNVCLRLRHGQSFQLDDHKCNRTHGYICERKANQQHVLEQRQGPGLCLPTIPSDLTRLTRSGALCVYSLRGGESPPILRECQSGDFIDECGCVAQTDEGGTMVKCSCGFCDLTVDNFQENDASMVWPSDFSCNCSANGTSSNVTVVNGTFTCAPDDWTGVPIGIPVGVTLALLALLVALVVGLIWWRRRVRRNNKGIDKPLATNTHVAGSNANEPTGDGVYNNTSVSEDNEYNTFNRPCNRRPSNNVPTDEGAYSLTSPLESSACDTFIRAGTPRPNANGPTDDGLYSATNPPGEEEYSNFDRFGNRSRSANAPTGDDVYNLISVPEDKKYSTFDRFGKRGPTANAPTDEGAYSLTCPSEGDV